MLSRNFIALYMVEYLYYKQITKLSIFGSKKGILIHTVNWLQRWSIIFLNYNFKMEYISSKKIGHADGRLRLIPKNTKPLEETVIESLKEEKELSGLLINTIQELPVTVEDTRKAAEKDGFIQQIKKQVRWNERNKKVTKESPFSICKHTLMYAYSTKKKFYKSFTQAILYVSYEIFHEELHLLAMYGPGHRVNDSRIQGLPTSS